MGVQRCLGWVLFIFGDYLSLRFIILIASSIKAKTPVILWLSVACPRREGNMLEHIVAGKNWNRQRICIIKRLSKRPVSSENAQRRRLSWMRRKRELFKTLHWRQFWKLLFNQTTCAGLLAQSKQDLWQQAVLKLYSIINFYISFRKRRVFVRQTIAFPNRPSAL